MTAAELFCNDMFLFSSMLPSHFSASVPSALTHGARSMNDGATGGVEGAATALCFVASFLSVVFLTYLRCSGTIIIYYKLSGAKIKWVESFMEL